MSKTPPEIEAGVKSMYLTGEPNSRIASVHGIHVATVSKIAARLGILRTKSEGQATRSAREATGWDRVGKKGAVQSIKTGLWHPCDSAYEYARMIQLDEDDSVSEWKRCDIRIPYSANGVLALYVPDIEVRMVDGSVRVEEIKPKKYADRGKNPAKFEAARQYFSTLGIEFTVITEAEIGWKRIRQLDGMPLNGVPDEERAQRRRDAALRHLRAMTPEQRADYNEKARLREAAKRAANRDEYNRRAREYRAARLARNAAPSGSLF
jgi:hypothetical protein